jgi:hypothetical protein
MLKKNNNFKTQEIRVFKKFYNKSKDWKNKDKSTTVRAYSNKMSSPTQSDICFDFSRKIFFSY